MRYLDNKIYRREYDRTLRGDKTAPLSLGTSAKREALEEVLAGRPLPAGFVVVDYDADEEEGPGLLGGFNEDD